MLHSHAHNFQSVHNQLHLPLQKYSSIKNEEEIKSLRIMSDQDYFSYPGCDSYKYLNMSPTGSSQDECMRLPH